MKGFLITLGVLLILGLSVAFWAIGVSNTEIRTRNTGKAQEQVCAAFFDKMWKILQQDAQVADQYKEAFKQIYPDLIAGRYSQKDKNGNYVGGGSLMKFIVESNPQFDTSLYNKLMAAIEGQREGFFVEQQKLIDIDLQHKNMRMTFPKSLIIGKRPDLGIVIIKSLKTDQAYQSGQENDVDLFNKKNN